MWRINCFFWVFLGGGFHTIDGDSIQFIVKGVGGNFTDSCSASTLVSEIDIANSISIFPNPSQNLISIQSTKNKIKSYSIYSILGTKIKQIDVTETYESQISIEEFSNGVYVLVVQTADGKKVNIRFIKSWVFWEKYFSISKAIGTLTPPTLHFSTSGKSQRHFFL